MSFQDKVAIVSGGSRGIGRAIVQALAANGARVAFTYVQNKTLADEVAQDGIVAYQSAHLEGVDSEYIVHGKHTCLDLPSTIEEVRRILLEHLQEAPVGRTQITVPSSGSHKESPVPAVK